MHTKCVVVTALSLLAIAESKPRYGGSRGYSRYSSSRSDDSPYSRPLTVGSSSGRSFGSPYMSRPSYNSSRVRDGYRVTGHRNFEDGPGVAGVLKNFVQGVPKALEQVGFKPDFDLIRKNLLAYSKKIAGKAVAQVDYEAKQIGAAVGDQAQKIADGYVGLVKQQKLQEEAMLDNIDTTYGDQTLAELRAKVAPEMDRTLQEIPDKNLENVARSVIGSINKAIDQQVPKELTSMPISAMRKQIKTQKELQYSQHRDLVNGLKSKLDEAVDTNIVEPLGQVISVAIAPVAKPWMRKCNAMAPAQRNACMAQLTQATAALQAQGKKNVMEAVNWYMAQYDRAMEAAKPSGMA